MIWTLTLALAAPPLGAPIRTAPAETPSAQELADTRFAVEHRPDARPPAAVRVVWRVDGTHTLQEQNGYAPVVRTDFLCTRYVGWIPSRLRRIRFDECVSAAGARVFHSLPARPNQLHMTGERRAAHGYFHIGSDRYLIVHPIRAADATRAIAGEN